MQTLDESIDCLQEMNFQKFETLRSFWLQHITFEWLIQGHIKEEAAL